uniref:Uncharacterized protein n=1 Tax=Gossypium raimondii TaxID=29730 RepID=A0A0D2RJR5_GOSRA|nr:hypothetical protein B456_011G096700 [Gossypium raimondii]
MRAMEGKDEGTMSVSTTDFPILLGRSNIIPCAFDILRTGGDGFVPLELAMLQIYKKGKTQESATVRQRCCD